MSPRSPHSTGLGRALLGIRKLSRDDWALLACALLLLPPVSAGLRLVGLRRVLALVAAIPRPCRGAGEDDRRDGTRMAWLVDLAARCVWPRPTCLAKAIVVSSLLRRRGRAAQLVIGVTKAPGTLEGHAWVELTNVGQVLGREHGTAVGAHPGGASYAELARIPGRLPSLARSVRHEPMP